MLPNLGRLSLQQADTRVVFAYNDTEKWDRAYDQKFQENECSICFERFKEGDELVVLNCGHVFHEGCFRQWDQNKRNCPLCRRDVEDEDLLTFEELFLKAAKYGDLAKVTQMLKDGIDVNAHDEDGSTALMWACVNEHTHVAIALVKHKDIKVKLMNNNDNTALHWASRQGMLAVVKELIAKDADVNKQNKSGNTALIWACEKNHADIALALLESKNIDVDLANYNGGTALHWASREGILAVVEELIAKDAEVNKQNKSGNTALIGACKYKQPDVALALLESKDIEVDLANETGENALYWASSQKMLAVVKKLIEKDAYVNKQNILGNTALILACYKNHTDVALALLEDDDIDVNLANQNGITALHLTSEKGMLAIVEKLIEKGADVNIQDEDGDTALIGACQYKQSDVALALLNVDGIEVDLANNNGETALHRASSKGMLSVVEELIEKRANAKMQDKDGYTALMVACYDRHTDIALALLKHSNINVDLANNKGETALHHASHHGMLAVVEKLIEKDADVNKQDKDGYTALIGACYEKHADVALALLNVDGIEVDLVNVIGETALHRASHQGMLAVVKKLIEKRADVNKQNEDGYTALIWACVFNHADIALALLNVDGIEVDLANVVGGTALQLASHQGMLAVVEKLIEKRADVNKQNRNGFTALMWACKKKHADIALALLEDDNIKVDLFITYNSTIYWASNHRMFAVVKKMIEKGVDVNVQDESGNTALIQACILNHDYVALALLERTDIDVDLVNNDGKTALYHASGNGMTEVVERIREIQSRPAPDDATPMEVDVVSPDDRRDRSGEGRRLRQRIRATAAARLRVRLQKLV